MLLVVHPSSSSSSCCNSQGAVVVVVAAAPSILSPFRPREPLQTSIVASSRDLSGYYEWKRCAPVRCGWWSLVKATVLDNNERKLLQRTTRREENGKLLWQDKHMAKGWRNDTGAGPNKTVLAPVVSKWSQQIRLDTFEDSFADGICCDREDT